MKNNIIVIGPIAAGKSTVCKSISDKTGMKHVDIDKLRGEIYPQLGYSEKEALEEERKAGIKGWYMYQKPYELAISKKLLLESANSVISFGGGHSVYHDEKHIKEFVDLMDKEPYVFLLTPCVDLVDATQILNERISDDDEKELNPLFVKSETNKEVAKFIIYTEGKTIEDVVEEIISIYVS